MRANNQPLKKIPLIRKVCSQRKLKIVSNNPSRSPEGLKNLGKFFVSPESSPRNKVLQNFSSQNSRVTSPLNLPNSPVHIKRHQPSVKNFKLNKPPQKPTLKDQNFKVSENHLHLFKEFFNRETKRISSEKLKPELTNLKVRLRKGPGNKTQPPSPSKPTETKKPKAMVWKGVYGVIPSLNR